MSYQILNRLLQILKLSEEREAAGFPRVTKLYDDELGDFRMYIYTGWGRITFFFKTTGNSAVEVVSEWAWSHSLGPILKFSLI